MRADNTVLIAEPYEYVTTALIAVLPCAAGMQLARWLLPGERRLLVVGGVGSGLGVGLATFGIAALVQVIPLLVAALVVNSAGALLAARLIWHWRHSPLRLEPGPWTSLVGALLLLVLFITGVEFVSSVWHANTHENLLIRLGLAGHFAAGNWPPVNPWEPDHLQFYRFGGQLWTAAVALLGGADVFAAGLAVTLIAVLSFLWGVAAAVTLLTDRATGLLAALLVAVAGPQNFLALPNSPFGELTASTVQTLFDLGTERFQSGYVLGESLQQLVPFSYTRIVGLAAAAGVAALVAAMARRDARRPLSLVFGSAAFAGMSVTAEHLFLVMAAALGLVMIVLLATHRRGSAFAIGGLVLAGSVLALIPEGPLAALIRSPDRATFLSVNADNLFSIPTHGYFGGSSLFATTTSSSRVGLLAPAMWKDFGWALAGIVGSGLIAALRRRPGLAAPAAAALVALLIPGVLHDELNPWNTGRFTQVGLLLAPAGLAIVLTELWRWRRSGRLLARGLAAGLAALAAGTWILTLALLPGLFRTFESPVLRDELAAADFAARLPYPQRALLLPGPRTFSQLNSGVYDGMHKYAVTFGRLQVPMGFDNRGARERYAGLYARAQDTLASADLKALEVDLVYAGLDHLGPSQRSVLDRAVASGTLAQVYRSPGGVRVIYRVMADAGG